MPNYTVITAKSVEHEYDLDIKLPLDMGDDTDRLADLQMRKAYENGSLDDMLSLETAVKTDDNGTEKIIAVFRGNKQIIPRLRKKVDYDKAGKKAAQKVIDHVNKNLDDLDLDLNA